MEVTQRRGKKVWYQKLQRCSLCGATIVLLDGKCSNCGSVNCVEQNAIQNQNSDKDLQRKKRNFPVLWIPSILYVLVSSFVIWRIPATLSLCSLISLISHLFISIMASCIIYDDALKAGIGARVDLNGKSWAKPMIWMLATIFMFPVVIPIYIFVKSQYAEESVGQLSTVVWALIVLFIIGFNVNHIISRPGDNISEIEKARIEKEEQRLSNPALFFSNEK